VEYRKLGNSGLKLSAVGLGCNNFAMKCDAEETRAIVHKALDEGMLWANRKRELCVRRSRFVWRMSSAPGTAAGCNCLSAPARSSPVFCKK
jgi:hypothetical protein